MVSVEVSSEKNCARDGNEWNVEEGRKMHLLFCCRVLGSLTQPRPVLAPARVFRLDHLTLHDGDRSERLEWMVSEKLEAKPVLQIFNGQRLHLWGSKTRGGWLAGGVFVIEGLEGRCARGEGEGRIL